MGYRHSFTPAPPNTQAPIHASFVLPMGPFFPSLHAPVQPNLILSGIPWNPLQNMQAGESLPAQVQQPSDSLKHHWGSCLLLQLSLDHSTCMKSSQQSLRPCVKVSCMFIQVLETISCWELRSYVFWRSGHCAPCRDDSGCHCQFLKGIQWCAHSISGTAQALGSKRPCCRGAWDPRKYQGRKNPHLYLPLWQKQAYFHPSMNYTFVVIVIIAWLPAEGIRVNFGQHSFHLSTNPWSHYMYCQREALPCQVFGCYSWLDVSHNQAQSHMDGCLWDASWALVFQVHQTWCHQGSAVKRQGVCHHTQVRWMEGLRRVQEKSCMCRLDVPGRGWSTGPACWWNDSWGSASDSCKRPVEDSTGV